MKRERRLNNVLEDLQSMGLVQGIHFTIQDICPSIFRVRVNLHKIKVPEKKMDKKEIYNNSFQFLDALNKKGIACINLDSYNLYTNGYYLDETYSSALKIMNITNKNIKNIKFQLVKDSKSKSFLLIGKQTNTLT